MTELALLTLYAERPLHPGAGEASDRADLPIQRETPTGLPMIQSSAIKNLLRRLCSDAGWPKERLAGVFGTQDQGGRLACTDARLLYFPVASLRGVYAHVTSPFVLARLKRDLEWVTDEAVRLETPEEFTAPTTGAEDGALFASGDLRVSTGQPAFLHDTPFNMGSNTGAPTTWSETRTRALAGLLARWLPVDAGGFWEQRLRSHAAVVRSEMMVHFSQTATAVTSHVKLGVTGTVEAGPWDEETLPAETALYCLLEADAFKVDCLGRAQGTKDHDQSSAKGCLEWLRDAMKALGGHPRRQLGANYSTGQGWVRLKLTGAGQAAQDLQAAEESLKAPEGGQSNG
jgi:CRISPR-associated protein Cmr4